MAARKKNINDIQDALLSNTQLMKEADLRSKEELLEEQVSSIKLDESKLKDFQVLADYLGLSTEELIDEALSHFLRLKSIKLEAAKETRK